jgi:lipoate---protein ligase
MAKQSGRIITQEKIAASYGLAVSEYFMSENRGSPTTCSPILYRYSFEPACVLVGRFEDVDTQVSLREVQERGLSINRRFTGGGTQVMSEKQLGISLLTGLKGLDLPLQPEVIFEKVGGGIVKGLGLAGVEATFQPSNQIQIDGKTLTILEIASDENSALFMSSCIFNLEENFEEWAHVTNVGGGEITKQVEDLKAGWTTLSEVSKTRLSPEKLTDCISKGLESALDVGFDSAQLTPEEEEQIRGLEMRRYRNTEWIFHRRPAPDMTGQRIKRTAGGSIYVYLACQESRIGNVMFCGDFSSTALTIRDLEDKLKDVEIKRETILQLIKEELSRKNRFILGVTEDILTNAILKAADKAKRVEESHRGDAPPQIQKLIDRAS